MIIFENLLKKMKIFVEKRRFPGDALNIIFTEKSVCNRKIIGI